MKKETGKIEQALQKSPINYFSDLFVVAMVIAWIVAIVVFMIFAIYSTICLEDNSIWSELQTLVAMPLSAGGAIWMLKNTVQHAIANNRGERAHQDFPRVDTSDEIDGMEEPMFNDEEEEDEE